MKCLLNVSFMKCSAILIVSLLLNCIAFAQTTTIGNTTYDFQSYGCAKNRIVAYSDGHISASWVGSGSLSPSFSDRGMFFNTYDGDNWGAYPTARLEGVKAGFGELLHVGDHELSISNSTSSILIYKNSTPGATDWTATAGSGVISGLWPVSFCPESSDDLYVINANSSTPTAIYYSRSEDGGNSWAIEEYTLPFLTTDFGVGSISAEVYQIVVYGADVYVLYRI